MSENSDQAKKCQVFYCDGTVRGAPRGHYWREMIGPGHFGPVCGPYETEDEARAEFERSLAA